MNISEEQYRQIYEDLDKVSPVLFDCGMICGASCCDTERHEDLGMYLLPGEEAVHDRDDPCFDWMVDAAEDYDFPSSWTGDVYFIRCHGTFLCEREKRPIQCRTFPAAPHLTSGGELVLIYSDADVPYICPMIASEAELSTAFLKATLKAWRTLMGDQRIYDLVKQASDRRGDEVKVIWREAVTDAGAV